MTVSAVFLTTPNAVVTHISGRQYTANSLGLLTVALPDGSSQVGEIGSIFPTLYLTGTTTDRLSLQPTGTNPQVPPFGIAFDDPTLSAWFFWVGFALSSTGWAKSDGTAGL